MSFYEIFRSILEDYGFELTDFHNIEMSSEYNAHSFGIVGYELHLFLVKRTDGALIFLQSLTRENPLLYFRISEEDLSSNQELEFYAHFVKKQIEIIKNEPN